MIVDVQGDGRTQAETQNLMTSKEGSVSLGDLKGIESLTAKVNLKSGVMVREWSFNNNSSELEVNSGAVYREGNEIIFPPIKKQRCNLWRTLPSTGVFVEDFKGKISFEESKLSIKGLPVG